MGLLELVTTMLLLFCLFRNTVLYVWLTSLQSCYVNMLMVWQGWKKEERVPVLAGEWWITFALALLSRLQHLSLHFLIKTSVSRGLRHLKSDSRMVSRSCQVDQQVKLLGVSRIQTQLLLFGSRGGGSLKTSSPINLAPPSSYVTFCHITEQPAPTNTLLPFCPRADLMYTQQVFKREREKSGTNLIDGEIL